MDAAVALVVSLLIAAPPLRLEPLLDEVADLAPNVLVQSESVAVERARVDAVGAWQDPTISIMAEDVPFDRTAHGAMMPMLVYRFEQPLNLFGRRGAQKRSARGRIAVAEAARARTAWDARAEAVSLFYELWMSYAMQELLDQQIETLERMRESAKARYAAGLMMAHHDFLRAEAEVARMRAERDALEDERRAMTAMLNFLRGAAADAELGRPELPERQPTPDLAALIPAVEKSPEVSMAEAMREEMQGQRDLAEAMFYPMVMVGAQYQQVLGEPDGYGAMLSFTVPLFFWDNQSNELAMADAMVRRAEVEREVMLKMNEADLRMAWSRSRARERALDALESTALPSLRQTLTSAQAEYVSGQGDFLRLLETVEALQGLEAQRIELVRVLGSTQFELSRLLGARAPASGSGP